MRKNLPVTTVEKVFPKEQQLISSTDIKGQIKHVNDAFAAISGFSREELIGQPHNIVRHPDMPEAAFRTMWSYLQQGKPWMGLVKNRCKNGDFYWVNAYVTPVTEHGKVVGYESVRSLPTREQVARAEALYQCISQGKKVRQVSSEWQGDLLWVILPLLLLVVGFGLWFGVEAQVAIWCFILSAISAVFLGRLRYRVALQKLKSLNPQPFMDDLAVQSYTEDRGVLGKLEVALLAELAHLNTVITRIEDSSTSVARQAGEVMNKSLDSTAHLKLQQQQTEQVATAMNEMTTTIAEVSAHVHDTATQAEDADKLARQGSTVAVEAKQAIVQLQKTVDNISSSVGELAEQTRSISSAAQIIEQIAEQTNLLALNAAIEAARAGDQGRGFAVVADEVRSLASRTTHSTKEIFSIIQQLSDKAKVAVQVAHDGQKDAEQGMRQVAETEQMLLGITTSVTSISSMAGQMAAAVEEQAHVAEDINRQLVQISDLANSSLESSHAVSKQGRELQATSEQLHELVERFRK